MNLKDKKGEFAAWFFVIIFVLGFSIFMLVLNNAWNEIETPLGEALDDNLPSDSPVNSSEILGKVGDTNRNLSNMLPFLIIGLFSFVLITAGAIMKHPAMIFIGIIILAIAVFIAAVFSNVYTELAGETSFSTTADTIPIQNKFMDYLPIIIFAMALGVVIALLYGKSQGGTGL